MFDPIRRVGNQQLKERWCNSFLTLGSGMEGDPLPSELQVLIPAKTGIPISCFGICQNIEKQYFAPF